MTSFLNIVDQSLIIKPTPRMDLKSFGFLGQDKSITFSKLEIFFISQYLDDGLTDIEPGVLAISHSLAN